MNERNLQNNEGGEGRGGKEKGRRGLVECVYRERAFAQDRKAAGRNAGVAETLNRCARPVWEGAVQCCSVPGSARLIRAVSG